MPLAHLQLASESHCDWLLIWHVFQVEKTPARVSTPTIDLTVASATSQREVPEFHEHPLTPAQSPDEVLAAQVSACLPSATTICKSFAELRIKSRTKDNTVHRAPISAVHLPRTAEAFRVVAF